MNDPLLVSLLKGLLYVLLALFGSPLLEGLVRKVKAVIHSRRGPPVTQPYRDLVKLLVKDDLSSHDSAVIRYAPPVAFAAVLTASFFVPYGLAGPAAGLGDVLVFVYLVAVATTAVMAGGLAQKSPYSHLGSGREMMMMLSAEVPLVMTLLIFAVSGHTALPEAMAGQGWRLSFLLGLVCYLFVMQAMIGKLPFDIPEAEQEIMEGPFVEYSGPSLALFKWTFYMKQLLFGSLFVSLFLPWLRLPGDALWVGLVNFVVNYVVVLVLGLAVVLVDATNPRLRIDQSMRFFGGLAAVAAVGLGLAAFGL